MNSEYVEGFYIYSRGLDAPARSTNMLTVLHAGDASGFLVTGLAKFTRYQFFLVPFYKTLDGRPSNARTARTLEDGKTLFSIIFVCQVACIHHPGYKEACFPFVY